LDRAHWNSASPVRSIFRDAFVGAGLPYFNPHSFRNTLVRLGQDLCKSPEEFKAWSQNLGHEKVLTTFTSYGAVARDRQGEILRSLAAPQKPAQSGTYWEFLSESWAGIAPLLQDKAQVVVRIGGTRLNGDELSAGLHTSLNSTGNKFKLLEARSTEIRNGQRRMFQTAPEKASVEHDFRFKLS
jgi:hypothetical protein